MAYVRERRVGLQVYLGDADVPMDTNHLEPALRAIPMGRKNWLFCWTEVGAKHAGIVLGITDTTGAAWVRSVLPHWLRHAYARTFVVDKRAPLPAAQALLGHASVQTTAAYAKTDLSQMREFVEAGFGSPDTR